MSHFWFTALLVCAQPMAAYAGWSCTMPSGAVIFQQLSGCPPDAIKAEQRDTPAPNPLRNHKPAPEPRLVFTPAAKTPTPPVDKAITPPKPVLAANSVEQAYATCVALRQLGATSCDVGIKFFSASVIDATFAANPSQAQLICVSVASFTRQKGSPFEGEHWELKIYSPYGAGTRPIAACRL